MPDLVVVVEALNEERKERFLAGTVLMGQELENALLKAAHWAHGQGITFRCVHYSVPRTELESWLSSYVERNTHPGWRDVILEGLLER